MGYNKDASGNQIFSQKEMVPKITAFKRTDNGTEQMNINGLPSGTVVVLWNGTGAGDTGGDWSVSGTGSETAGSKHSGTNGWDTGTAAKDGTTVWNNGSEIDVEGTYSTLQLWLNPQAYPNKSELQIEWLNGSDSKIGSTLKIDDYVDNMDLGVWQHVLIPVADFQLTADVQKLRVRYAKAAGQDFYFDDIELVESGGGSGPYEFEIAADGVNTIYHLSSLVLNIIGSTSGWNSDAFATIASGIDNGLLLRHKRKSTSAILWSMNCKDNLALYGQYNPQDSVAFADGKLLVGFMLKPELASIKITNDDVLQFVVRDDLSSLDAIRAYAQFGLETVS